MLVPTCMQIDKRVRRSCVPLNNSINEESRAAMRVDSTTGGMVRPCHDSTSAAASIASASTKRPLDSSQRGDSGIRFRITQITSAPTPTRANIARQPIEGMIK